MSKYTFNVKNSTQSLVTTGNASFDSITAIEPPLVKAGKTTYALSANTTTEIVEGTQTGSTLLLTVTRSGDLLESGSVNFGVTGTGANPAAADDFLGGVLPSGKIEFAANETTKTLSLAIAGDATIEADESFAVTLTDPVNGTVITTAASVIGTLLNDDVTTIELTGDDDFFQGTVAAEVINGLAGDDVIYGRDGNDRLVGDSEDDTLDGGSDDDVVEGGSGDDDLYGGSGNDTLYANSESSASTTPITSTVSNQSTIPETGQNLSISLTAPNLSDAGGSVTVDGLVSRSAGQTNAVNIAFVFDTSGSMGNEFQGATVGDLNNDGSANTLLDAAISSFQSLVGSLTKSGFEDSQLALIPFSTGAKTTFNDAMNSDSNNNNTLDIVEQLAKLDDGGDTNYAAALNQAIKFFDGKQGLNYVFFISDGQPNGPDYTQQVKTLIDASGINATIRAIGLGDGASLPALDIVDDNKLNNSAIRVNDTDALTAGLVATPVNSAEIDSVELYRNGSLITTIPASQLIDTPLGLKFSITIPGLDLSDNSIVAKVIANDTNKTSISVEQHVGINGGDDGDNTLVGGSGDDVIYAGSGNDLVNGGSGVDTLSYEKINAPVTVNLNTSVWQDTGSASFDQIALIENLTGSQNNDVLIGDAYDNVINGSAGADTLTGGQGNDTYSVDQVNDVVVEKANAGLDTVASSISYSLGNNLENLVLTGSDVIDAKGNALDNQLTGNTAANTLDGTSGVDTLIGGVGDDTYIVRNLTTVIIEQQGEGVDNVNSSVSYVLAKNVDNLTLIGNLAKSGTGNTLANVLTGNAISNTLDGGAGDDILTGGAGKDKLTGGLGADHFVYLSTKDSGVSVAARDVIDHFSSLQNDKIDLSAIDANASTSIDDSFSSFTQGASFSGAFSGSAQLFFDQTKDVLYGNNDSDSSADFSIQLTGVNTLAEADFIF